LLDKTCIDDIYEEARLYIPRGFAQLLLLEKRYSTHHPKIPPARNRLWRPAQAQTTCSREPGRPFVILREPAPSDTPQGDVLSYHLEEAAAVASAETYTRQHHRRAVVGVLLWDAMWL
jgi:hypothetical protein